MQVHAPDQATKPKNLMDWIEWAGNKLPEPALLFALLACIVIVI